MSSLKCKITDAKRVSPYNFEYLVGVEFNDGEKKWRKAFKFDIGRLATTDDFKEQLRFANPNPDVEQNLLDEAGDDEFEVEFVPQREN